MAPDEIHTLNAAYALDALDDREAAEFEAHLSHCNSCREELAALQATASALAFAVESPAPSEELRDRILAGARRERENVVPLPSRRVFRMTAAAAAVAASAALGLGIWTASMPSDGNVTAGPSDAALAVLADPGASHVALEGADGALVVAPSGDAALVLRALEPVPEGSYYTAWVSRDGESMTFAGSFTPGGDAEVVPLEEPVPDGGLVAVTVEPRPDAEEPSSAPVITSART